MTHYVVATVKSWNIERFNELRDADSGNVWHLITDKKELTPELLEAIKPRYVFFPHWSWIIPKEIYENYECVVFHMTDLPYGRGGSPLQNLITRGHTETKISAIRVSGVLDGGDVYEKQPLTLEGTADEIFRRCAPIVFRMIRDIAARESAPVPQTGTPVVFPRRKPEESDMAGIDGLRKAYDHIRMLDGEGYPRAFLEIGPLRLEFDQAKLDGENLNARVTIKTIK